MRPPEAEGMGMKRREFLGIVGGAAAWPVVASVPRQDLPDGLG
jgi:hypothetical protein